MANDPTFLGTVQDVRGSTISIVLDDSTVSGMLFVEGHAYRIGQVGSFVKVPIGYLDLYGIVSEVGAGAVPEKLRENDPHGKRWMTVELVGEGSGDSLFQRGLSQYPTIGDSVNLVTKKDLQNIYGRTDSPNCVKIGHLANADSIPTLIDIDKLVTRHSAVVGTTGAGKSTTVASLLRSLSEESIYPSSRILLLDVHGEYGTALKDRATIFRINADEAKNEKPLHIPYWAMTFDELLPISFGISDDKGRGAILEKITSLKLDSINNSPKAGVTEENLTVDTPVPFSIHKMWFDLHTEMKATHLGKKGEQQSNKTWALELDSDSVPIQPGNVMNVVPPIFRALKDAAKDDEKIRSSKSALSIGNAVDRLASKLRDPRFDFLFKPGPWLVKENNQSEKDIDELIQDWVGGDKPISILDLSGVPTSILTDLIGALLRIIYEALFWSRNMPEGGRERPLLVVLEEAHVYLKKGDMSPAVLAVQKIVKEGRKYGVGAMIVSQRPSEIESTILSQCGTIFAMRLSNSTDRGQVISATSDHLSGLFDMMPILRTGEMIITGEAVRLPVRTVIDPPPINMRPDSSDPLVYGDKGTGGWDKKREDSDYAKVVKAWRKQDPRAIRGSSQDRKRRKTMERTSVSSSNIASIGYDSPTSTLQVEFNNGGVYEYYDVPEHEYDGIMGASSHGVYLNQNIKGSYRYARV